MIYSYFASSPLAFLHKNDMYSPALDSLKKISEQIRNKDEWWQGSLFSPDGKKQCLAARVYQFNIDVDIKNRILTRLVEAVETIQPSYPGYDKNSIIDHYNDTHSHDQIVSLVEKAIDLEQAALKRYSREIN